MEFDPATVLRASKLRIGNLRAQGAPAILFGVAGVILAAGAARSMREVAPALPQTLRELKSLIEASRPEPRVLKP